MYYKPLLYNRTEKKKRKKAFAVNKREPGLFTTTCTITDTLSYNIDILFASRQNTLQLPYTGLQAFNSHPINVYNYSKYSTDKYSRVNVSPVYHIALFIFYGLSCGSSFIVYVPIYYHSYTSHLYVYLHVYAHYTQS